MRDDTKEIEQVLYRCCHAVDQGRIDHVVNLFHPNGVLVITWEENGTYEGHEALRQWFFNYDQGVRCAMKYLRHKITCPVIEVHGDEATAFSYLDVESCSKEMDQVMITAGRYEDELVRYEGCWCLKKKVVFMDKTYTL